MTSTHWDGMKQPDAAAELSTRKVDASLPQGVSAFWAKPVSGNPILLIEHPKVSADVQMPKFKIIEVRTGIDKRQGAKFIWIELLDRSIVEQFARLCDDVVEAVSRADAKHVSLFVKLQLEKWNHLLSSKRMPLGPNEQKGLIAELFFLDRFAMKKLSPLDAIKSWTGPLKCPRDFSFGNTFVEVKSNKGAQNPSVSISSEHQLASSAEEELLLFVVALNESHDGTGFSLDDVVESITEKLNSDYLALEELMLRLAAVGYSPNEGCGELRWKESDSITYWVMEGFPRLQSDELQTGVHHVKYDIDLNTCTDYLIDSEKVFQMIGDCDGKGY